MMKNLGPLIAGVACFWAMTAAWGAVPVAPAAGAAGNGAAATYRHDRAACMSGRSNEDQATCLKEAAAAYAAARQGGLTTDGRNVYERNALARCQLVPAADRDDCRARVLDIGRTRIEGSVAGGGLLRETTTTVPVAPPRQ